MTPPTVSIPSIEEVQARYWSVARLVGVQVDRAGLSTLHDHAKISELFAEACVMGHEHRLVMLAELGQCTDDLVLPERPR